MLFLWRDIATFTAATVAVNYQMQMLSVSNERICLNIYILKIYCQFIVAFTFEN